MFIQIPDLNFSIPDPGSRVKKILDPDTGFGIFLDSGKNYLGCSSWIRIHILPPIPDPRSRGHKSTGTQVPTSGNKYYFCCYNPKYNCFAPSRYM
jgi:hypothetical protein